MTDPVMADHVYLKPLTVESIVEILDERKILYCQQWEDKLSNLCIEADEKGVWESTGAYHWCRY